MGGKTFFFIICEGKSGIVNVLVIAREGICQPPGVRLGVGLWVVEAGFDNI